MARSTLDPKLDIVFKLMFVRRPSLLVPLLEPVLRLERQIRSAKVLNPELPRDGIDHKGAVLDLHVLVDGERHVNLEMQRASHAGMRQRALYYATRLFGGQLHPGQSYEDLCPCSTVFFLAEPELDARRLRSVFRPYEASDGSLLSPALEVHFIELTKFRHATSADAALQRWSRFFMAYSDEEYAALAREDSIMQEAKTVLDEISADQRVRELARSRELAEASWKIHMAASRKEGRQEGLEAGLEAGLEEGRKESLVRAITRIAEKRGQPLDADRSRHLSAASVEELETLLLQLV